MPSQISAQNKGIVLLSSVAFSAVTQIDFINLANYSNYKDFWIEYSLLSTGAGGLYALLSTDNGATFKTGASDYTVNEITSSSSGITQNRSVTSSSMIITGGANAQNSGDIKICNPLDVAYQTTLDWKNVAPGFLQHAGPGRNAAEVNNALRFATNATSISGQIQLYGISI